MTEQLTLPLVTITELGDPSFAEEIVTAHRNGFTPDGWKYIGCGSFRTVYRGPDNFVYKVAPGNTKMQRDEVRIFHTYATEPWCPPAWLHWVDRQAVVVMPYLPAAGPNAPYKYGQFDPMYHAGLHDLGSTNYSLVNGQVVVIDAGNHDGHMSTKAAIAKLLCPDHCPCRRPYDGP